MKLPAASATTALDELRAAIAYGLAREIPAHVRRCGWSAERLREHQRDRLRALITHAIERSPFHAQRLAGLDPRGVELDDLEQLPIMTREQTLDGFDDIVTDHRLTRAIVDGHLNASVVAPSLLLRRYVCLTSSGRGAAPGVFVQSVGEYATFAGAVMRPAMARILAAGGSPAGAVSIGLVAAASPIHSTGMAAATALDGPIRMIGAPATLALDEIVARLNLARPRLLMGYPARLAALAAERRAGRLRIAPTAITSTGQALNDDQRAAIADGFGVAVADQFAATMGLVGHSEPGGSLLRFAGDMCLVELVDADGRPVADGEASARVLVTNLHNLTQPLIRYELHDRLVRHCGSSDDGHLHASVEVRTPVAVS